MEPTPPKVNAMPARALAAALCLVAAGCQYLPPLPERPRDVFSSPVIARGHLVASEQLQQITPGVTARADVQALLGSPSQTQARSKRSARPTPQAWSPSFSLGWARQLDGSLALVGDLGRIAAASPLQELLSQLSHRYALRQALQAAASTSFAGAELTLEAPVHTASSEPLAPSLAKPRPRS